MSEQLKDFPVRTVIKRLEDGVELGGITLESTYLYKNTDEGNKRISKWWSGIYGKKFIKEYDFFIDDIKKSLDRVRIEMLYPRQEIEDYTPQVGDVFMWINNQTAELDGILFTIYDVFAAVNQLGIKDHNGNFDSCDTSTVTNLLKNNLVALVDGPCMASPNRGVPEVSTPKNNDGRANCYACGGALKD